MSVLQKCSVPHTHISFGAVRVTSAQVFCGHSDKSAPCGTFTEGFRGHINRSLGVTSTEVFSWQIHGSADPSGRAF